MNNVYISNGKNEFKNINELSDFSFINKNGENIIRLCQNGDIYVKGKLVENDKEVVNGMRELLGLK